MTTPRNNPSDVREIFHTDLSHVPDSAISTHIRAASREVDRIPTDHPEVSDGLLEDVELHLACHRVESQVPRPKKESHESAGATYAETVDYRDTAEDLDPTGTIGDDVSPGSIQSIGLGSDGV